ncbi:unnamed protein product, partial [Musa acuminata var. zebrina]
LLRPPRRTARIPDPIPIAAASPKTASPLAVPRRRFERHRRRLCHVGATTGRCGNLKAT